MTTYNLNFTIDPAGVAAINDPDGPQFITLVKQASSDPGSKSQVAWLTFPAAQTINVSWEESYYLYATNVQAQAGAQIQSTAITPSPALAGNEYTFNSSNLFVNPLENQPDGTFVANNQVGTDGWRFGLAQYATINGGKTQAAVPLNIVRVLNNQIVTFIPEETVSVYLSAFSNNGVVITSISSPALIVTLTSDKPSANLDFDDKSNTFHYASNDVRRLSRCSMQQRPALASVRR